MSEKVTEQASEEISEQKFVKLNVCGANDYFIKEAFKSLRTNIQFCGSDKRVIFLTGTAFKKHLCRLFFVYL